MPQLLRFRFVLALLSILFLPSAAPAAQPRPLDLLVYGGTASGVVTAYTAARQGLNVVLVEPGTHLGGMVTGGLSATDVAYFPIIGGYARQFYKEAAEHYGVHTLSKHDDWLSEPHVGEQIFQRWLKDSGVPVRFHSRLREHGGVQKQGARVVSVTLEDGTVMRSRLFADCSYEGDLMAEAGVSYTVGREGIDTYHEDLAGVRTDTPKHQFLWNITARDAQGRLSPEVNPEPMAAHGSADKKVQAYNLRMILTDDPANRLPWSKPAGYDPARFDLLLRYLHQWQAHTGREPGIRDVTNPVMIPHRKGDFNNNGAFSTDYLGASWTYPDATYAERQRIWDDHVRYTQSFFWFLSSDPRVPAHLRDEANTWGRAKDEFTDNDGWPNQLYIREGRRMLGRYVMRQADLQVERTKPDSIAMGSYNSDSHNVQRVALPDGFARNEGDVQVSVRPYEISFGAMLPKAGEADNLLVPVCLSASHVAYSSVRMEPQYMMIGQAAGNAAALAVQGKVMPGEVKVAALQALLRKQGAILHLDERSPEGPEPPK